MSLVRGSRQPARLAGLVGRARAVATLTSGPCARGLRPTRSSCRIVGEYRPVSSSSTRPLETSSSQLRETNKSRPSPGRLLLVSPPEQPPRPGGRWLARAIEQIVVAFDPAVTSSGVRQLQPRGSVLVEPAVGVDEAAGSATTACGCGGRSISRGGGKNFDAWTLRADSSARPVLSYLFQDIDSVQ